ncbi:aldo/keto reductase [Fimbriimonas ginsengisoli]|uniref:Oxidoreductase n=1 Tax=Fimbriimonas ginsengisoli Gsoil 348 TaxID=661478 RepID=A0A068NR87_FIMGI|nr:aldo/keto reductase [Fimbriimonas ginsengisoli]AIE84089.1 Oxidoreductase [Fimbriimonas ginsengisoli Gsoil 348]
MERRRIGSLEVSLVGLGCNNFGRRVDEAGTKRVVDAAIAAGVDFFDTADIYGGTKSEEFLGSVLKGRRHQVVLATKFGMEVDPDRKGAHPVYIRQAAEDSLRRLQTDHIDLYQLHTPDPTVPIADTLGALDELVQAGKVREIGCSNFSVAQLREAEAAAGSGARFVSVQNEYSLFRRDPEEGVLAECERQGLAFLPFFPLASGLLTGKYRKGHAIPEGTRIQAGSAWLTEANLDKVEGLIRFAESKGHSLLELAFSWLASKPVIASVIAGATRPEQVDANSTAADWKLAPEELAEIDRIMA